MKKEEITLRDIEEAMLELAQEGYYHLKVEHGLEKWIKPIFNYRFRKTKSLKETR